VVVDNVGHTEADREERPEHQAEAGTGAEADDKAATNLWHGAEGRCNASIVAAYDMQQPDA
jgi:hypothetical protein